MTAVVLAGDFPSTGILQATVAQRFGLGGGDDASPAFIDHMAHALGQRDAVLVIYPSWRSRQADRMVRLARSALLTDRIAGLPLDVPPLALSLIADQLTFASSYARPGVLASLAQRLCESVYAGAWVNSVARLEHIKTGLGAHVSSYLPGKSGFSVSAGSRPAVHRITSAKPVPEPALRPTDPVLMLFAHENGNTEWLHNKLRPTVGAVSVTAVAAQPMSSEYWGTRKYAEFVAFSGHPRALQTLLAGSSYRPCGWCGEPIALPECPFCLMAQPDHGAHGAQPASQPGQERTRHPSPQLQPQPAQPHSSPAQPPPVQSPSVQPQFVQPPPVQVSPQRDPRQAPAPAPGPVQPPAAPPAPSESRPEYPEAPPTRPQTPEREERRPQPPPSTHPHDPHPASPVSAADELCPPTRREPVLAAPVEVPADAGGRASGTGNTDDGHDHRTPAQTPPSSWGNSASPDDRRAGEASPPADASVPAETPVPADTPEPAGAETDAGKVPLVEGSLSIERLLNGAAPQNADTPDPEPATPDDEWPRAGTVAFRPPPR